MFEARGSPPWPVVIYLHGGYWRANDKKDSSFVAAPLARAGISAAVVEYPLMPQASMDVPVRDVRTAVSWLYRNADRLDLDCDRFYLAGHSSGAHLAAMAMAGDWTSGLPAGALKGACLISGLYDLRPLRYCHVNEWTHLTTRSVARNSPIYHLPHPGPELRVAVGSEETDEFRRQSNEFAGKCAAGGVSVTFVELARHNHFETPEGLYVAGGRLKRALIDMVGSAAR